MTNSAGLSGLSVRQSLRLHDRGAQLDLIRIGLAEIKAFRHGEPGGIGAPREQNRSDAERCEVGFVGEHVTEVSGPGVVLVKRRHAEDQVHGLKYAGDAEMDFAHIVPLHPGAYGKQYGSSAIHMIVTVLRVVLNHKDRG